MAPSNYNNMIKIPFLGLIRDKNSLNLLFMGYFTGRLMFFSENNR